VKISKLFAITLQTKNRLIFFIIASIYNLLLGLYLKDFLVLSQTLMVFYLLSVSPSLFLVVEIKSKVMRIAVYISLILVACMNIMTSQKDFVLKVKIRQNSLKMHSKSSALTAKKQMNL